jgi:ATP-dependent Clp protease ATP-binding subunit ClpC
MASVEARDLGSDRVGTEHLLLGLLAHTDGGAARRLGAAGVTLAAARRKVAEAVGQRLPEAGAGAQLAQPPSAGHLPRTPRAERAINRAFRFSNDGRSSEVQTEHLLLGVLDVEGTAGQVLRGLGVDLEALGAAQTGSDSDDDHATAAGVGGAPVSLPDSMPPVRCGSCSNPLDGFLDLRVLTATDANDRRRDVAVVSCRACGTAIGVVT